jgi:hypothetical protein
VVRRVDIHHTAKNAAADAGQLERAGRKTRGGIAAADFRIARRRVRKGRMNAAPTTVALRKADAEGALTAAATTSGTHPMATSRTNVHAENIQADERLGPVSEGRRATRKKKGPPERAAQSKINNQKSRMV